MVAWQFMIFASHTPPHIKPPLEIVAMLALLLVKAMSAATITPEEFSAVAESVATSPSFSEKVVGERTMVATVVLVLLPPPPQAAKRERRMAVRIAARTETTGNRRMYPPRQFKISGGCMKPKNDSLLKALSVEAANSFGKAPDRDCRCSKIMSPHNCNQTLSPCKDGDLESERVPT